MNTIKGVKREKGSMRGAEILPTPIEPLKRIEDAAVRDITVARQALGLFDCLIGALDGSPFTPNRFRLVDVRTFPPALQREARVLVEWALVPVLHDIGPIYRSSSAIKAAVIQIRRESVLGKRYRRRTVVLSRQYPPIGQPDWSPYGTVFDLLPDECGKPLTERVLAMAQAFKPTRIQVVQHNAPLNGEWTVGVLTIRLNEDGYTVGKIALSVEVSKPAATRRTGRIEGELVDYFETGTEGVVWTIDDERRHGREALETICEGDHLTIEDQLGIVLWKGVIRCDKKTGWQRYRMNPEYGQQIALGHWVHWVHKGCKPDDWARFFIRPGNDRLRGVLLKKRGAKRDPKLGPE
jgi:hypothetical protein